MAENTFTLQNGQTIELDEPIAHGSDTTVFRIGKGERVIKILSTAQSQLLIKWMQRLGVRVEWKIFLQDIMNAFQAAGYGIPPIDSIDGGEGTHTTGSQAAQSFYYVQPMFTIFKEEPDDVAPHCFFGEENKPVVAITETTTGPRNVLLDWNMVIYRCLMFLRKHSYQDLLIAIRTKADVPETVFLP